MKWNRILFLDFKIIFFYVIGLEIWGNIVLLVLFNIFNIFLYNKFIFRNDLLILYKLILVVESNYREIYLIGKKIFNVEKN